MQGGSPNAGDKLTRFAYAVTHLFQITRWDRTFRLDPAIPPVASGD
jgi:hypothetical protein